MDRYPLSRCAHAAEVATGTLARWLDTSIIRLRDPDIDSNSSGIARQFSVQRVMQIAATQSLTRLGVSPSRAAAAASAWTDHPPSGLEPAGLFAEGGTWLLLDEDGGRVVNLPADAALSDALLGETGWSPAGLTILDLRRLSGRVLDRLSAAPAYEPHFPSVRYETKASA